MKRIIFSLISFTTDCLVSYSLLSGCVIVDVIANNPIDIINIKILITLIFEMQARMAGYFEIEI